MRAILILVISMFIAVSAMPQKLVGEKKVPENVKKVFKKKASQAVEPKWFVLDTIYTVKYFINEKEGQLEISVGGKLLTTKIEVDYDKLPTKAKVDFDENHKKKKIERVFYVEKSKKDKYYSVIATEKRRKQEPARYEIQYDTQGNQITIFEPEEEPQSDEQATEGDGDETEKMEKEEAEAKELKDHGKEEAVKRKDLPSAIGDYLEANFNYEYVAKEIFYRNDKKIGEHYFIVMKKQGEKVEHVMYFDLKGNLLKREER